MHYYTWNDKKLLGHPWWIVRTHVPSTYDQNLRSTLRYNEILNLSSTPSSMEFSRPENELRRFPFAHYGKDEAQLRIANIYVTRLT